MNKEEYIGTTDAAKLLGRNPSTVAKMIKAGQLSGVKVGKGWHLKYNEVLELSKTIKPSAQTSRENIAKAREAIKPKAIKNKIEKRPSAKLSTMQAIDKLLPAHAETMGRVNGIRVRVGLGEWPV